MLKKRTAQFKFILLLILLTIVSSAIISADGKDSDDIKSKNMAVVSETKNNIKVTWFPVSVWAIDKEYNITIENLENNSREPDIDVFFNSISGGIDNLIIGSIKLSYLTDLTKIVDDYSKLCTDSQVTLSAGEPNQTTGTITSCIEQNNPKTVAYKGWKEYPVNEIMDKVKQELTLQKTNENGKIALVASSKYYLNLKFKTKITNKPDGTYGNDGQFGLLLNGVLYHPTFNTSYNKRYIINITANDAIDTNYTHNVTFAFTGNSNEIGSGTKFTFGANNTVSACNNLHVIFNGTTEIAAEVSQCNSSSFSIYFINQTNITRNGTALNQYEIYYDPAGTNYQRPDEYVQIWLPGSDSFDKGFNSTRWLNETIGSGLSYWVNTSNGNGLMYLDGGADPDDGCFRGANNPGNNITQINAGMQFLMTRSQASDVCNSAWGLNDRICGGSPNTNSHGIFFKDDPPGFCPGLAGRTSNTVGFTSGANNLGRLGNMGNWGLLEVNYTANTRSTVRFHNASGSPLQESFTTNVPNGTHPLRVLMRVEGADDRIYLDNFIVYQIVNSSPTYTVFQENRTIVDNPPSVALNNPPNGISNISTSQIFNANYNDDRQLVNATLYHDISGVWVANQTLVISGTSNSSNFSVANIVPGNYKWNVQACDNATSTQCSQASQNFTFNVKNIPTISIAIKNIACTAENRSNNPNSYNQICKGSYSSTNTCGNSTTNDFLTCDDGNVESQDYMKNKFAGLHLQASNISSSCQIINDVFLCYEWWVSGGTLTNCLVAVDANGNASYTNVTTTCPGATPNPGIICTNITSLENWTCSSFFGTNGTKAVIRNELSRSNAGPADTLFTDALFFNVTHTSIVPEITRVDINSTNPTTNDTNQNITIYPRGVTDPNDDFVTNITNWFKNSFTLTILNLPFDTNVTNGSNVKDYSGKVSNGTPKNVSWTSGGLNGGAYSFVRNSTSSNSAAAIAFEQTNDLHLNQSYTIEAWFKTNSTSGFEQHIIISKRNITGQSGWKLGLEGALLYTQRRGGADPTLEYNLVDDGGLNRWNHVAIVYNGTAIAMWVQGLLRANVTINNSNISDLDINDLDVTIGNYAPGSGIFDGLIDTVRIYNRSLSQEEIIALNNSDGNWLTIVGQETGSTGENWSACVTPNDALQDGTTVCSQNLTIG